MSRKNKNMAGFTLLETVGALALFVLIGVLITVGMNLTVKAEIRMRFEADSATLCDTLNTALRDILRFASCDSPQGMETDGKCRITCPSCGAESGYFFCGGGPEDTDGKRGVLYLNFGNENKSRPVVSTAAYGGMVMTDFRLSYDPVSGSFSCTYSVRSENGKWSRDSGFTVRTLNGG